ncbi:uncharacterized protein LOC105175690 isoform X2 [Sesamum indicum]|uniref:Uncharacterized protein LOC105175690 isoform X2 n=1 Tax=Sesamum indicum TaxID=4182 RepID=A0A6I9U702_SESIN|nr:uncharacterized protein LOC105175690 isoform X2 [Sesamum indicum]
MALVVIIFHKPFWSGCSQNSSWICLQPQSYITTVSHPGESRIWIIENCRNPMPNLQDSVHMRFHAAMLQQLKEQCDQKNEEVEAKKRRGKEIETALENSPCQISDERLSVLDINQLKQLKEMMEKLRENVRRQANAPTVDSVEPPPNPTNVAEPPIQKDVDLGNVERDEREASPIPPDWLKL